MSKLRRLHDEHAQSPWLDTLTCEYLVMALSSAWSVTGSAVSPPTRRPSPRRPRDLIEDLGVTAFGESFAHVLASLDDKRRTLAPR